MPPRWALLATVTTRPPANRSSSRPVTEDRGLAEALGGDGFDIEAAATRTGHDLEGLEAELLASAQQAGSVRTEVTPADVKALLNACVAAPDRERMIRIVTAGLRP
ncbi:hypothetical protein AB0J83_39190 [Actinoplanes sp. NPDC049596]|uniref:SbtR family transcriptional regulator n=1 Tax=unclassified Actinoplanes TaxID=2626549 RepID=UPI003436B71D